MEKEIWIYKRGKYIKATSLDLFWRKIKRYRERFKIVDTWKYKLVPYSDSKYYFKLSPKEYDDAEKLYKEKGTISYEFYPCAGMAWGVKIHALKTDEIIDISDVSCW